MLVSERVDLWLLRLSQLWYSALAFICELGKNEQQTLNRDMPVILGPAVTIQYTQVLLDSNSSRILANQYLVNVFN